MSLKDLMLQVGLLRPGEPPAFGVEYMLYPMQLEYIICIPQELQETECMPEAQTLLELLPG